MLRQAFSEAARKPTGSVEELRAAIIAEYPDFETRAGTEADHGLNGYTFLFPDEVIKGARSAGKIPQVEQEARILRHLEDRGVSSVPRLTREGKEAAFIGMTRLPGKGLNGIDLKSLSQGEHMQNARDIGGFMADFAGAFTEEEGRNIFKVKGNPSLKLEEIEASLTAPMMRAALGDDLPAAETALRDFRQTAASRQPVATHNDLHNGNIMFDPTTRRVSGVIDFGYAGLGLPEEAFACFRFSPPEFLREMCTEYTRRGGQEVRYEDVISWGIARDIKEMHAMLEKGDAKKAEDCRRQISDGLKALGKTANDPRPSPAARPPERRG